jgi:hypothetical protein
MIERFLVCLGMRVLSFNRAGREEVARAREDVTTNIHK